MTADARATHAPPCQVHGDHRPRVGDVEVHHIWPKGMGGPDVPGNKVSICPTGHTNVHMLLREWVRLGAEPPWEVRQRYHPAERDLAERGFRDWAASLPALHPESGALIARAPA